MKPRLKKIVVRTGIGLAVAVLVLFLAAVIIVRKEIARVIDDDPAVWNSAIEAFEKRDTKRPPPLEAMASGADQEQAHCRIRLERRTASFYRYYRLVPERRRYARFTFVSVRWFAS
jgi:hypothetical protein